MSQVIAFSVASIRRVRPQRQHARGRSGIPAFHPRAALHDPNVQATLSGAAKPQPADSAGANDDQSFRARFHHRREIENYHQLGRRGFEAFYKLDINAIVKELNEWYEMENRR